MSTTRPRSSSGSGGAGAGQAAGSDRRVQLLTIAAGLFATKGYAQTTVRDIADEAGILSGSLYHHFSSKEAMIDEILREFLDRLLAECTKIEKEGDSPQDVLDGLVSVTFSTIHATPHAVALYQNESTTLGRQPGFEYVEAIGRKIEKIWLRVLTSGQESGAFRSDIDINLTYRFIRDTVWVAVRWYRPGGKHRPEVVAGQYLNVLHGGLLTRS